MSLVDKFRKIPTAMIALHIFSKVLIGIGLGAILAKYLVGIEWWLVIVGVILSIPPIIVIFTDNRDIPK